MHQSLSSRCTVNERTRADQRRKIPRRLTRQQNGRRLKTQQRLRVAVREGAQKRYEADQGRRPPVGQTAERIAPGGPLGMKLEEHGEAFGDREKHGRNMDELYAIES